MCWKAGVFSRGQHYDWVFLHTQILSICYSNIVHEFLHQVELAKIIVQELYLLLNTVLLYQFIVYHVNSKFKALCVLNSSW